MNEDDTFAKLRRIPFKDAKRIWDELSVDPMVATGENLGFSLKTIPYFVDNFEKQTGWTADEFLTAWNKWYGENNDRG